MGDKNDDQDQALFFDNDTVNNTELEGDDDNKKEQMKPLNDTSVDGDTSSDRSYDEYEGAPKTIDEGGVPLLTTTGTAPQGTFDVTSTFAAKATTSQRVWQTRAPGFHGL